MAARPHVPKLATTPVPDKKKEDAFGDDASPAATIAGAPTHSNYTVAPPPATGLSALRQFGDVTSVNVVRWTRARDARQKEVVFYEVACMSMTNAWTVLKRFSDFYDFHVVCKDKLCLEHHKFVALPDFPSRVNVGSMSDSAIEKRRQGLHRYMNAFLTRMKEVEMHVRMGDVEPEERDGASPEARLGAAIQHFVAFVRGNSPSCISSDAESPGRPRASEAQLSGASFGAVEATPRGGGTTMGDDIPPVRITRYGDRAFVAMLYVAGVASRDMYVMTNPELPRHVIVGGRWNGLTASAAANATLEALLQSRTSSEPAMSTSGAEPSSQQQAGAAAAGGALGTADCYYDTLPVGEFEVTFEVPEPFSPSLWFTEHRDGVCHVIWTNAV